MKKAITTESRSTLPVQSGAHPVSANSLDSVWLTDTEKLRFVAGLLEAAGVSEGLREDLVRIAGRLEILEGISAK